MAARDSAGIAPKKPHGNAFAWSEEIEDEILRRISMGEAVTVICGPDRDGWLPSEPTFYKRVTSDEDFFKRYMRAREIQGHREFEETLTIADGASAESVSVDKLRIDTRKWRAGKLAPKAYGDKVTHANDPENPLPAQQVTIFALPDNGRG